LDRIMPGSFDGRRECVMRATWVRRALVWSAVLALIVGWAPSTSARQSPSVRRASIAVRPADLPSTRVDVDPRVARAIARGESVDALLVLDGATALAGARAASSEGFLRAVSPAYRELRAGVISRLAVPVLGRFRALPILHVRLDSPAALRAAAADPDVIGIAANRRFRPFLSQSLPLIGQPTVAAQGHTGAGFSVAVLDTGVNYMNAAFGTCAGGPGSSGCRVVEARDFAPNDGQLDANGHGTNVSGIVAGVAPEAGILGLDVFDGASAFNSDIIDAVDFVIANQATYDIVAMNLSLGSFSYNTSPCSGGGNPYVTAFANARAAGIVPVVATGNSAFSGGSFHAGIANPACTPGALPVGAVYDGDNGSLSWGNPPDQCDDFTTAADQITCFSQAWSNDMLLAPGALIVAAGIEQGGTSQATPHVAGAIAVLHDAASAQGATTTPDQVQTALLGSGPLINDPLVNRDFHRLDLPAAVAILGTTPPPPPCTVTGDDLNNTLVGTAGNDVICGEGGNDVLIPSGGSDILIGGDGFDYVSLENATSGGTIDLVARTAVAGGVNATLQEVEGGFGSPFDDVLTGDGATNEFFGLGGNDAIDGGGGFDFARYDTATTPIQANLGAGTATGDGSDALTGIEGLVGGRSNDELVGNGKANALYGLKGSDVLAGVGKPDDLFGGPGSDELLGGRGNDDLFGGPGRDRCTQGPGHGTEQSC
jgi:hypothetical protein